MMTSELDRRISIAICDTQPLIAEGLRSVLADAGVFDVLEPTGTLEDAARQVLRYNPRAIMFDKALGVPPLIETLLRLHERTTTSAIVWGNAMTEAEALRFMKSGAKGILRKTCHSDAVRACLDTVVNGGTWMEEALFREHYQSERNSSTDLTVREQQVLELVEQGLRNKDIGERLGIRPGTVKIHLKHIFEKTGIRGRYGLALSCLRTRESGAALRV